MNMENKSDNNGSKNDERDNVEELTCNTPIELLFK
jgi:hypothetical protein